jgi:16S rRNA (cytosine1402-N4)-methyltransferase
MHPVVREMAGSKRDVDELTAGHHEPVLLQQCLEYLAPGPGMVYIDGTVGSAGHFSAVARRISPGGMAIGIDRDELSLRRAKARIEQECIERVEFHFIHENFSELWRVVERLGLERVDRILFDFGLSSDQLDDPERGFSFRNDGPLDMRQDRRQELTAETIVNDYPASALEQIFREFGEERYSKRIAAAIVESRRRERIVSTVQLASLVAGVTPPGGGRIHPATRVFQALRMEVGGEAKAILAGVAGATEALSLGGLLGVITFHGLEERLVKQAVRPFSRHGERLRGWVLVQQGELHKASVEEARSNPRSRSAKLRVYGKVVDD